MKRFGWVVVVAACGRSPAPLPVTEPVPLADYEPVLPPDAAIVVDAGPDPSLVKALAAAEQTKALAARHDHCVASAKQTEADLPKLPPPSKRKPTAAVALTEVGDVAQRDGTRQGMPIEGPWKGEPTRKKLAGKLSAALTPCYAEALKRNPDLHGGITVGAGLNEDGSLTEARVIETLIADTALQTCVTQAFAKIRIPGGSKDSNGFEAYFDLVFCPPQRGACLIGLRAPDAVKGEVRLVVEEQLDRISTCYKAAGKSHGRGVIERSHVFDMSGTHIGGGGEVRAFIGDDKNTTAATAAEDCENTAWDLVCLQPRPDVYSDDKVIRPDGPGAITTRLWFQR